MSQGLSPQTQRAGDIDVDVLVAGYGPAGEVLAGAIARAGHRVAAVDRWPAPYGLPRLVGFDGEAVRIVQSVASVDEALQDSVPFRHVKWYGADGQLNMSIDMTGTSSGFAGLYSVYQPDIEAAIERRTATYPNAMVMRGTSLVSFEQDGDGVTATVGTWRNSTDGVEAATHRAITAKYLVACDGARSTVRAQLDVELEDFGIDERWLNFDALVKRPLPAEVADIEFHLTPERPYVFMPIGTKRHRFEIRLLPHETEEEMVRPEVAWNWLKDKLGLGPDDVEIIRDLVYPFPTRIAKQWRVGRVFLAGDAALHHAALHGHGRLRGDARCEEPGLEARPRAARTCRRHAARHLSTGARTTVSAARASLGHALRSREPQRSRGRQGARRRDAFPAAAAGLLPRTQGRLPPLRRRRFGHRSRRRREPPGRGSTRR